MSRPESLEDFDDKTGSCDNPQSGTHEGTEHTFRDTGSGTAIEATNTETGESFMVSR